jgi:hypothetical protein
MGVAETFLLLFITKVWLHLADGEVMSLVYLKLQQSV